MASPQTADETVHLRVFANSADGGNPVVAVIEPRPAGVNDMRAIAERAGTEAGFVLPPTDAGKADIRFRFFNPRAEMEMCGHATLGMAWLLAKQGRLRPGTHRIETASGIVLARVSDSGAVAISQPSGTVEAVNPALRPEVLEALGLSERDLLALPILNAATSRKKTFIPLTSPQTVNALEPDHAAVEEVCAKLGSTGLYPFACDWDDERTYHARQFPAGAGIAEDPATGVAAAALYYALKQYGLIGTRRTIRVRQGEAMGRPSRIAVTEANKGDAGAGVWLTGDAQIDERA